MIRWETLFMALSGLGAHKPRSVLKMFGLIVGAAEITLLGGYSRVLVNAVEAVIVAILLVLGGIGVRHIMLVSITDRTREIGLSKALGATDWTILGQFVLEAAILAGLGGLLGVGLGVGMILLARALVPMLAALDGATATLPLIPHLPPIMAALWISIAIGAVAGSYPAYRAAHIDTVHALRSTGSLRRAN